MPAPEHSANHAARLGRWSDRGLSREEAAARETKTIPGVVSAAAFALVASRPWARSSSAPDSERPSSS